MNVNLVKNYNIFLEPQLKEIDKTKNIPLEENSSLNKTFLSSFRHIDEVLYKTNSNEYQYKRDLFNEEKIDLELIFQGDEILDIEEDEWGTFSKVKKEKASKEDLMSRKEIEYLASQITSIKQKDNDYMYIASIKQSEPISINTLYKASFLGKGKINTSNYSIEEKANVLQKNGIEPTDSAMRAVDKLLKYGETVSSGSIKQLENLECVVEGLSLPKDNVTYEEASNKPLMEEEKILYTEKDMQEIVDDITSVSDDDLSSIYKAGKDVSVNAIREMIYSNTNRISSALEKIQAKQIVNSKIDQGESPILTEFNNTGEVGLEIGQVEINEKVQLTKENIDFIRRKLTVEAAQKLSSKFNIEELPLSELAKEINMLENAAVEKSLAISYVEKTPENIAIVKESQNIVNLLSIHKSILSQHIGSLDLPVEDVKKAILNYEKNALVPQKRFGDNVNLLQDQIIELLSMEGLDLEIDTIDVAKGLLLNGLPVNKENIELSLPIIQKINTYIEEMTPLRVSKLLKQGINTLNLSIDEALVKISEEKIPQLKSSISEAIVNLKDKHLIDATQEEGLIGFYKILHAVETNKEQVIGYLMKNNLPLTLENLDRAAKYSRKNNGVIDKNIDVSTGLLKSEEINNKSARNLILKSQEANEAFKVLNESLAKKELLFEDGELKKIQSSIYSMLKMAFKKEFGEFNGQSMLSSGLKEKIDYIKDLSGKEIEFLKEKEIPVTINNLYWAKKIHDNPDEIRNLIKSNMLNEKDFPLSFDEIEETFSEMKKKEESLAITSSLNENIKAFQDYKSNAQLFSFEKEILNKEGIFHIPFVINGEQKMVDLYLPKKENKKDIDDKGINAVIKYQVEGIGDVMAYLSLKDKDISYRIVSENAELVQSLNLTNIDKALKNIGYDTLKKEIVVEENEDQFKASCFDRIKESDFELLI